MRESPLLHSRYWSITLQRLTSPKEPTNPILRIKENQEERSDDERKLKQGKWVVYPLAAFRAVLVLRVGLEQNEVQTQWTLGVSRLNAPSEFIPCILTISQAILPVRSRPIQQLACCEVLLHINSFPSE